jgi:hypothetical protein
MNYWAFLGIKGVTMSRYIVLDSAEITTQSALLTPKLRQQRPDLGSTTPRYSDG